MTLTPFRAILTGWLGFYRPTEERNYRKRQAMRQQGTTFIFQDSSQRIPISKAYEKPRFDGESFAPEFDEARLKGQMKRVYELMKTGGWLTLYAISACCQCTESSASARLRDFRKVRFGGHTVNRRRTDKPGVFEYQMVVRK